MFVQFIENLFPFLFIFTNPSIGSLFSSAWVLLIIAVAIYFGWIFYKSNYVICYTQLEKTNRILSDLIEKKPGYEEIKSALMNEEIIGHYWSEFLETIVRSEDENGKGQIFNTIDADHFFNQENLINHKIDTRFYNALPGILTGLGILGTFLGLILGLSQIDLGAADPTKLRNGIIGLLDGATIAFATSIWGISLSIAFNILEKRCLKKLGVEVDLIQRKIDSLFDKKTAEGWLSEIGKESGEQTKQLKKFNDDLAISIASALEEKLAEKLSPSLDKLFEAIENLNTAGVRGVSESIQKSAGHEFERVAEIMRGVGETMKTTADYGQQIQSDLETSLNQNIDNFSNKIEEVFKDLSKSSGDQTELIKNQINDLNTTTFDTTNKVSRLVEKLTEKFSNNMDQATQSINEERQSVGKLLSQVNNSIENMKNLMEEAGLVADTFKESSHPVKEAVSFLNTQVKEISKLQQEFIKSSQNSTDNWNSSIDKMENIVDQLKLGITDTKDLWSGYKNNFNKLREELNEVFKGLNEGLISYRKETGDSLGEYLQTFDQHFTNGMGALQGAITDFSESIEDLNSNTQ